MKNNASWMREGVCVPMWLRRVCCAWTPVLKPEQGTLWVFVDGISLLLLHMCLYMLSNSYILVCVNVWGVKGCQFPFSRVLCCQRTYVCLCDLLAHCPYRLRVRSLRLCQRWSGLWIQRGAAALASWKDAWDFKFLLTTALLHPLRPQFSVRTRYSDVSWFDSVCIMWDYCSGCNLNSAIDGNRQFKKLND